MSHLLLDLQDANRTTVRVDCADPLHSWRDPYDSAPSFISSLGAFIDPDAPAPRDEDLEWDVEVESSDGSKDNSDDDRAAASRVSDPESHGSENTPQAAKPEFHELGHASRPLP